jgi:pyroglutamyl-peptidase
MSQKVLCIVGLACILGTVRGGEAPAVDKKPVCLLTGFEPFGGLKRNISWETVKAFNGQELAGYRLAAEQLPVVYDQAGERLAEAIKKHRPALVISFGVGTRTVTIEATARNDYNAAEPLDNAGKPPPRKEILPGGKAELATGLPMEKLLAALQKAGIGAKVSQDAGGYLCNECFYRLMAQEIKDWAANLKVRGFVHLPEEGLPDPAGGRYDAEKLRRAVRIIVETAAGEVGRGLESESQR